MKNLVMLALALFSLPALADFDRVHGNGNDRGNGPARGEYHLNVRGATCEGARAMVQRRGSVLVYYGEDQYDRVVSGYSYCPMGEMDLVPFYAPGTGCFVGYTCERINGG